MGSLNLVPASTADYRRIAERKLPRFLFDYLDGGSYAETTLNANVSAYQDITLKQTVLKDVSSVDASVELFGSPYSMPTGLAPIGMGGMFGARGELQAKAAADALNIPFTLSTVAICSLEEVAEASDKPFWFQLYMLRDRGAVQQMLQRAQNVGVETLVFTVDLAVLGARYRDKRNGLSGGTSLRGRLRTALNLASKPSWIKSVGLGGKPHTFGNLEEYVPNASRPDDFQAWITQQVDASVTWKDIEWLRDIWPGKLIIKGILTEEDAKEAVQVGADGIVVSNHGGRQLDCVDATINVVSDIKSAVGATTTVILDGGIRSGQDVFKAYALGADFTLIGRSWVYALAAAGQRGITDLLRTFKAEIEISMALTGTTQSQEINRSVLKTKG
ncbi:MAG: L-lactate dehydrogenase [Aequoribacter sp.]|uniref:L-lactate dehydrogenase n=1 Tax=Aequoribacter sp. TaxID=2847771 RepID=UPI003C6752A3